MTKRYCYLVIYQQQGLLKDELYVWSVSVEGARLVAAERLESTFHEYQGDMQNLILPYEIYSVEKVGH